MPPPVMAAASLSAAEMLPRFLLPRLSWSAPLTASQRVRPSPQHYYAQWRPVAAVSLHSASLVRTRRRDAHEISPLMRRTFHATAFRQRDHHFDTLKFVQRLQSEGFTEEQSVAMMKVLNDVIEER